MFDDVRRGEHSTWDSVSLKGGFKLLICEGLVESFPNSPSIEITNPDIVKHRIMSGGMTKTTTPCCSYTVRASLVSGCVCWLAAMMVCLLPTTIAREPQYGWDQQYGEYV